MRTKTRVKAGVNPYYIMPPWELKKVPIE